MNYPLISEYIDAILSPEDNLDKLNFLHAVLDNEGRPIMSSGNFAVVFKMTDGDSFYALKCFTKDQEYRNKRYHEIDKELSYINSPFLIHTQFLENELFVDTNSSSENEFPVVLMEWVEGITLDAILRKNLTMEQYYNLALEFSRMGLWIISQPFAHGDIKPDNIIVKEDGKMVLIDYDGMYVPALENVPSCENGTPGYTHPMRTKYFYNERIDDFSLIVIELSLLLLYKDPNLIENYRTNQYVISPLDFNNIENSKCYDRLLYYRTDRILHPIIETFLHILRDPYLNKEDLDCLSIPEIPELNKKILQGPSVLPFLGDVLWNIYDHDMIRAVDLQSKILKLFSPSESYDGYVRLSYNENSKQYDIVITENNQSGYISLNYNSLKSLLLSLDIWDFSLSEKINYITNIK